MQAPADRARKHRSHHRNPIRSLYWRSKARSPHWASVAAFSPGHCPALALAAQDTFGCSRRIGSVQQDTAVRAVARTTFRGPRVSGTGYIEARPNYSILADFSCNAPLVHTSGHGKDTLGMSADPPTAAGKLRRESRRQCARSRPIRCRIISLGVPRETRLAGCHWRITPDVASVLRHGAPPPLCEIPVYSHQTIARHALD